MKRKLIRRLSILALWTALCALAITGRALAETRVFTYGGSLDDVLSEMAVSADGHIVLAGYTSSTDGTLALRTKDGHTGWALCVNAQGDVLWTFCTRLTNHDFLRAPVIHEDGSVTLLIYSDANELGCALLRLSADGEDLGRSKLTNVNGNIFVRDDGYALARLPSGALPEWNAEAYRWEGYLPTLLYDWDGEPRGELTDWTGRVTNAAGRFSVQRRGGESQVWRRSEDGKDALFARIVDTAWQYGMPAPFAAETVLPLEDGGVALAGWAANAATRQREGRFIRWDAQGKLVFDMRIPGWELYGLTQTESGFAATAGTVQENGVGEKRGWRVIFFDAQGIMGRTVDLPACDEGTQSMPIAALPDGTLAVLQATDEELLTRDTRLILLGPDGVETSVALSDSTGPAPEAEEAVYYVNPDGGKRYHVERECGSIDEVYWPGMVKVTVEMLREDALAYLEPCPRCGAEGVR